MSRVFTLPPSHKNVFTRLAPLPPPVKGTYNKPDLSLQKTKLVQGAYFCGGSNPDLVFVSE